MPEFPTKHEEFVQSVSNHLREREGCPVMVIVHSPAGLEMQMNFMDFALQLGIIKASKMTIEEAFKQGIKEGNKTGLNQIMVSAIKDANDSEKKKVN